MSIDPTIATRGVAEFSRQIERYGFLFREQQKHDEGVDAQIEIQDRGMGNGRLIGVQIKTGASYFKERSKDSFVHRFGKRHEHLWRTHSLPMILCLVDLDCEKIYWQHISDETVSQTGKDFKILVPIANIIDDLTTQNIARLATPVVASTDFSVHGPSDVSLATAKRFSANIILHTRSRPWSQSEIASVIRQVTRELKNNTYCRDANLKAQFGSKSADVIWLYVYTSEKDASIADWVCRSLWIDKRLDPSFRPLPLKGEHAGDDIRIEWNPKAGEIARIFENHRESKSEYLPRVNRSVAALSKIIDPIASLIGEFRSGHFDEATLREKLRPYLRTILEEEEINSGKGASPTDCSKLSVHFSALLDSLSNIEIILRDPPPRNRHALAFMLEQQIESAKEHLPLFIYESKQAR